MTPPPKYVDNYGKNDDIKHGASSPFGIRYVRLVLASFPALPGPPTPKPV